MNQKINIFQCDQEKTKINGPKRAGKNNVPFEAVIKILPSLLPLPFLPRSFLPSFLPLLVSFYVLFDALF